MPRNDILRNDNKVFATAPHPSLRDTFSPRAKALMWLHLCLYERRIYGTLSGDCHGATNTVASRNDIIVQRALPRRFLHALYLVEMTQPDGNLHYLVDLQTTSAEVSILEVHEPVANG